MLKSWTVKLDKAKLTSIGLGKKNIAGQIQKQNSKNIPGIKTELNLEISRIEFEELHRKQFGQKNIIQFFQKIQIVFSFSHHV